MDLKERIKDLCNKQGISMNQLEQELGFGKGYISKLGKSTPNTAKIQQIAKRLNTSIEYLMNGVDPKENKSIMDDQKNRLFEYAKRLMDLGIEPDDLESLINAVEKMQKKD
jgi:transcriptional regulator with XRE-family HTH domain